MRTTSAVLLMAVLATGCATSSDPNAGGFFSGCFNLAGGGYKRRQREREERLDALHQQNQRLERINLDLAVLVEKWPGMKAQASAHPEEAARIEKGIENARSEFDALREDGQTEELGRRQQRIDALRGEIDLLKKRAELLMTM